MNSINPPEYINQTISIEEYCDEINRLRKRLDASCLYSKGLEALINNTREDVIFIENKINDLVIELANRDNKIKILEYQLMDQNMVINILNNSLEVNLAISKATDVSLPEH